MLARSRSARSRTRTLWLVAAAAVFGSSVWSLHFVAMLAFLPAASMAYSLDLTAASMLVAFGGALLAFGLWLSPLDARIRIPASGVLIGLAVSGMHYVGVDGMRFSGLVFFDRATVFASIAAAILFAIPALARGTSLTSIVRRVEITGWLALSICSLHFTGMSAMTLSPGIADDIHSAVLGTSTLAAVVGIVSLALLVVSLTGVLLDQHLSQRAHKELGRMRLLSNLAHEVLLIYRDGIVLEANNAAERLFKASADDLIGRELKSLFAPDSVPALARRSATKIEDRRSEELDIQTSIGTHVAVEFSCQPIEYLGKPATAVALRDLTERKRDEAQIRHLARHDALTNLPNRYTLQERLEQALDAVSREASSLAVVYLDLDRFKPVNDLYGHAAGDQLLIQVSKRILAEILPGDTLARIGGDEFVLILQGGIAPDRVAAIADRILAALSRPFQIENHRVEIGASIGIALYPGDGGSADTLLRAADTAMYRVKDEGRGSIRFFETSMDDQLQIRRQLEQELGHAIERRELLLHYQPLVNGLTGEVETFEALIRWQHSERGLIPPMDFIPLAEGTGQINAIGKWVIDTACAEAASWPYPCRVSVNVSPVQFRQSDICAVVAAALARNNLDPSRLVVEITESVLIGETGKAVHTLERLRAMGIRIALDDFGTGYSSLSYLQKFKFDKIKVDKSFVHRLGQDEESRTIARTIVNLGHNLGLQVTAEGVETVQQLACLQDLGCDQIQGYLVSRPLPMDFFTELDRARVRSVFKRRDRLSA